MGPVMSPSSPVSHGKKKKKKTCVKPIMPYTRTNYALELVYLLKMNKKF